MKFLASDVAKLAQKYAEIRALRREPLSKEAAEPRMRALAKEFPGALRELQGLPIAAIEARIRELDELVATGDPSRAPAWVTIHLTHHRILRCVLTAKRWFSSMERDAYADAHVFETLAAFEHDPETARVVARALDRVRQERRGSRVALALTAEVVACDEATVRAALWQDMIHERARASARQGPKC